jgi:hypothetical protein
MCKTDHPWRREQSAHNQGQSQGQCGAPPGLSSPLPFPFLLRQEHLTWPWLKNSSAPEYMSSRASACLLWDMYLQKGRREWDVHHAVACRGHWRAEAL